LHPTKLPGQLLGLLRALLLIKRCRLTVLAPQDRDELSLRPN
jgi:hypothetical protein